MHYIFVYKTGFIFNNVIIYKMNVNQESVFRDTLYESWVDKSVNVILIYLLCTSSDVDFIFGSHH